MCYFFMRKKILSIYLAVAIGFLSVVASAVPVYASNSTNWEDYYTIKYNATSLNTPYTLKFKSTTAQEEYSKLSKAECKKVDWDAFAEISAKDQEYKYGDLVLEKTSLPDLVTSIASAAGIVMSGTRYTAGAVMTEDIKNALTKISNSISASNRKFGGGGMNFKASTKNPANFGLGKITLTKDFINDLRSNVAKFDNYTIYPALSENVNYYPSLLGLVNVSSFNNDFKNYFLPRHYAVFSGSDICHSGAYEALYFSGGTDGLLFYYNSSGSLYYADLDSKGVYQFDNFDTVYELSNYYSYGYYYYMSSSLSNFNWKYNNNYSFIGRIGLYTKVFNSRDDLNNYINSLQGLNSRNFFISSKTINNDYSTTINNIYNYANGGYTEDIQGQIDKAITDKGSGLTDEEYQKIVDDAIEKLQQEIDSKKDTDDSGSTGGGGTGGDSGGSSSDSGESNSWLEKIYNRLGDILEKIGTVTGIDTITEYIKQIADDVATLKEGGSLSADMSDTNGLLKDIKGLLGTLIAVQAVGDVADLLADTVGDKINDYADNLKSAVTEVADALQDVFPFSIPWDLMAILALFSAEAQAPVFDIPVNIPQLGVEHNIHVDLSDFESVSVICRAFLSVSFAVGLMYLTIRITGGKDDD